jgi:hypothetical protein
MERLRWIIAKKLVTSVSHKFATYTILHDVCKANSSYNIVLSSSYNVEI